MALTADGFTVQTIEEIRAEIEAAAKDALGPNLDVSATSVAGQLIGIFADREHDLQTLLRDVWSSFTPSGATGASLTALAAITGTIREDATYSTVTGTVDLNGGTTLPAGSRANVAGDVTAIFETLVDVTNGGGSPAAFPVVMRAVNPGAVRANAGTLTAINTPVSGWTAVTNASDATMGRDDETDAELRLRREQELRTQGSSNLDAIEADVREVDGVLATTSLENTTDEAVGDLLPHSFAIVVWDGDPAGAIDDEIAQAIWDSKPAGIRPEGNLSGTAVDIHGDDHTVAFFRADQLEVYLEVDLTTNLAYPLDGDTQVKEAIVAYADANWTIGSDVIISALYSAIHAISGVVSIDAIRAGFTVSPSGTANLTVGDREIATADTSRIVVNS